MSLVSASLPSEALRHQESCFPLLPALGSSLRFVAPTCSKPLSSPSPFLPTRIVCCCNSLHFSPSVLLTVICQVSVHLSLCCSLVHARKKHAYQSPYHGTSSPSDDLVSFFPPFGVPLSCLAFHLAFGLSQQHNTDCFAPFCRFFERATPALFFTSLICRRLFACLRPLIRSPKRDPAHSLAFSLPTRSLCPVHYLILATHPTKQVGSPHAAFHLLRPRTLLSVAVVFVPLHYIDKRDSALPGSRSLPSQGHRLSCYAISTITLTRKIALTILQADQTADKGNSTVDDSQR